MSVAEQVRLRLLMAWWQLQCVWLTVQIAWTTMAAAAQTFSPAATNLEYALQRRHEQEVQRDAETQRFWTEWLERFEAAVAHMP